MGEASERNERQRRCGESRRLVRALMHDANVLTRQTHEIVGRAIRVRGLAQRLLSGDTRTPLHDEREGDPDRTRRPSGGAEPDE